MNFPINLSPESQERLKQELALPVKDKVNLLLSSLSVSQKGFSELSWIPVWTIATLTRRNATSRATEIMLNIFLRDTAHDRYVTERARKRMIEALKRG